MLSVSPRLAGVVSAFGALVAAALIAAPPATGQPVTGDAVTIPNFWDPAIRTERPAPGLIQGIRFTTTDDFPPFNFVDAGGRLTGFNVDLARAICDELDVPCTIQARPWDDLIPSVLEGRADAAIAGIAITASTREMLAFSDVYLKFPARFVVRKGLSLDISPMALARRRVTVVQGSAHEAYLAAFFPDAIALPYATAEAALAALRAGQADAAFGDGMQLAFWLGGTTAGDCCAFAGGPLLDSHYFGEGLAIALRSDQPALRSALNAAMEALFTKGVYAELYLRYFPIGFF